MITTAKALGNGFPVSALLLTPPITARLKLENLGTTFGGGPMACAVDRSHASTPSSREDLLANVRRVSAYLAKTCAVGPVDRLPGRGLPARACARTSPPKDIQKALLAQRHPRRHRRRSVDPAPARRRSSSKRNTSTGCAPRWSISSHEATSSTWRTCRASRSSSCSRSPSVCSSSRNRRRSPARSSACCSSIRRCARSRRSRPAMARLGGNSFVITAGPGHLAARDARAAPS